MALIERIIVAQVTVIPESNTIQVRWDTLVERDGEVLSRTPRRKAYGPGQQAEFELEVNGAVAYVGLINWNPSVTPTTEQIIAEITIYTQSHLDTFARTRNYDGILSACTYATSTIPQFAAEGQYCVTARDATWAALYTIMAEVQAGTRAMPTSFADVEPDLPVLVWPV